MASHGQDGSKIDAISKFGKKQLEALDQKTFSDILAEVSAHSKADCARLTPPALVYRHRNVWAFHCQGIIVNLIWSPSLITS
jgi:hypothetical protein